MNSHCKVYLWERWLSPGHIAIELPNKTYISFWPRPKGQKIMMSASGTIYSAIDEEMKHNGHPTRVLLVPGLDVGKMNQYWLGMTDDNPKWNLASFNCSDAVFEALCEGSDWFKDKAGYFPNTPTGVANLAQKYTDEKLGVTKPNSKCVIS